MQPVIKVEDLVKRYKNADRNAVDGISFSVEPGEFFAFLGPNGAGKTTTISILTTTLSKTSGRVEIAGFNLDDDANKVRGLVGIIFQKPSLDENLTAEENVRLHAILYGLYSFRPTFTMMAAGYRKRVFDLAEVLGIEKDMFKPVRTLSGGMKRKMEIIRSLMHKPRVLFLDEPTEGLDPASRRSLWEYLQKIRKEQETTFFLTTHYLEEAEQSDRVCIIKGGTVISLGTPLEIKKSITEEYLLVDAEDRSALREELETLGLPFGGEPPFKVDISRKSAQEVIQSIRTPLTVLNIHSPSLEDAYLEIVREEI
ncbi:MAG: ABC transporter ATP-binding protein [Dehalococcoidia bacterium]|nr:ABC transporter ATP-binding protein [Dehalococcoidia bacterium]